MIKAWVALLLAVALALPGLPARAQDEEPNAVRMSLAECLTARVA